MKTESKQNTNLYITESFWHHLSGNMVLLLGGKEFIYLFLERREGREKERERNINVREKQ